MQNIKNIRYILSTSNAEVKYITKLHEAQFRKKTDKCIFQNVRAIETALQANLKLYKIYLTQDNLKLILDLFRRYGISTSLITIVSQAVLDKISTLKTSSGMLAIFYVKPNSSIEDLNKVSLGLVLAQVNDPGNMGALIRTAAACDIKHIFVIEGADPYSTKVIQASAGTIALVDVYKIRWQDLILNKKDISLYALVVKGGQPIENVTTINKKVLLVVGNEANGIREAWLKDCDKLITLKMPGNTESLNAAVAGSIAIYLTFCYNV